MSRKHQTYGGVLKWHHEDRVVEQVRCINPPTRNAAFADKIRDSYPDYTLKETWRDKKCTSSGTVS